jgi:hypothetical protein
MKTLELDKALNRALKNVKKDLSATSSSSSAGFLFSDGQKRGHRKGYQVFVTVSKYSDELRKNEPLSGGLEINREVKSDEV